MNFVVIYIAVGFCYALATTVVQRRISRRWLATTVVRGLVLLAAWPLCLLIQLLTHT
jgi:hypothetical protein